MKGESPHLCKLQMESRVLQIAKADSVINGVYCLNIMVCIVLTSLKM